MKGKTPWIIIPFIAAVIVVYYGVYVFKAHILISTKNQNVSAGGNIDASASETLPSIIATSTPAATPSIQFLVDGPTSGTSSQNYPPPWQTRPLENVLSNIFDMSVTRVYSGHVILRSGPSTTTKPVIYFDYQVHSVTGNGQTYTAPITLEQLSDESGDLLQPNDIYPATSASSSFPVGPGDTVTERLAFIENAYGQTYTFATGAGGSTSFFSVTLNSDDSVTVQREPLSENDNLATSSNSIFSITPFPTSTFAISTQQNTSTLFAQFLLTPPSKSQLYQALSATYIFIIHYGDVSFSNVKYFAVPVNGNEPGEFLTVRGHSPNTAGTLAVDTVFGPSAGIVLQPWLLQVYGNVETTTAGSYSSPLNIESILYEDSQGNIYPFPNMQNITGQSLNVISSTIF